MITSTSLDRSRLLDWYRKNRERSASLFALIHDDAFYDRPIPLRHPFAFYEGHIPAFSYLTLNERALQEDPLDPLLEHVFERGIDPATLDDARRHERTDWPHRRAVAAFAAECDRAVLRALQFGPIEDSTVPRLVRAQSAYTILEHEAMHDETLLYIVHQLDAEPQKIRRATSPGSRTAPEPPARGRARHRYPWGATRRNSVRLG